MARDTTRMPAAPRHLTGAGILAVGAVQQRIMDHGCFGAGSWLGRGGSGACQDPNPLFPLQTAP